MQLQHLKLFHYAASSKNLTDAAKTLFISQPALTMQLKKFEFDLGIKLFDRVGNKNVLNENGNTLYSYTRKIFDLVDEAEHVLLDKTETIAGTVNIGGGNTAGIYILPKIIGTFKKLHPDVNINLHVSDTNEIAQMVQDCQLDLAVNGGFLTYSPNIHVEPLIQDRLILIASPENRLTNQIIVSAEDLTHCDIITPESQSQLYESTIRILKDHDITPHSLMKFGSIEAIKQAVEADLGIAFMTQSAVRWELKLNLLKILCFGECQWLYPQSLIYNKHRYQSPASRKFMKHLISESAKSMTAE